MKTKVHQHPSSYRGSYFKNKNLEAGNPPCVHKTTRLSGWFHLHKACHRTEQFRSIEIPEMDSILHLGAWGSDVVNEVKPKRVKMLVENCLQPPCGARMSAPEFLQGPL